MRHNVMSRLLSTSLQQAREKLRPSLVLLECRTLISILHLERSRRKRRRLLFLLGTPVASMPSQTVAMACRVR